MNHGELFSVLMAVYQRDEPQFLAEALESIANQTLKHQELVLVIDGPIGKELEEVIRSFQNSFAMVIVRLPINEGLAAALNAGLTVCKNDLIVRMDSDDICLSNRFERLVGFMAANTEIAVCSSWIEEARNSLDPAVSIRYLPESHADILSLSRRRSPISHPACCYRKSAVLDVGGYPDLYPEDYLLWIRMLKAGYRFANLSLVLLRMRTPEDFYSRRGARFLKGEIATFIEAWKLRHIGFFRMLMNCMERSLLRLAPRFVKRRAYLHMRGVPKTSRKVGR